MTPLGWLVIGLLSCLSLFLGGAYLDQRRITERERRLREAADLLNWHQRRRR